MKQHITIEQLNELSDEQWVRLKKWNKDMSLLSIGQMIEFLDEEDDYFKTWYRQGKSKISKECRTFEWLYDTELCNALWEAVKEVLNEKI